MANILKVWDEVTQSYVSIPAIRGDTGATPNITIGTVQTLNAGSDATVSIGGTAENPVLNIGIPKGNDGHTPVNGTDYWTQAEKTQMVQDVLSALPTWTGGSY